MFNSIGKAPFILKLAHQEKMVFLETTTPPPFTEIEWKLVLQVYDRLSPVSPSWADSSRCTDVSRCTFWAQNCFCLRTTTSWNSVTGPSQPERPQHRVKNLSKSILKPEQKNETCSNPGFLDVFQQELPKINAVSSQPRGLRTHCVSGQQVMQFKNGCQSWANI